MRALSFSTSPEIDLNCYELPANSNLKIDMWGEVMISPSSWSLLMYYSNFCRYSQIWLHLGQRRSALPHSYDITTTAYCHHEKWDGTGYHHGLKRQDTPIFALWMSGMPLHRIVPIEKPCREIRHSNIF